VTVQSAEHPTGCHAHVPVSVVCRDQLQLRAAWHACSGASVAPRTV